MHRYVLPHYFQAYDNFDTSSDTMLILSKIQKIFIFPKIRYIFIFLVFIEEKKKEKCGRVLVVRICGVCIKIHHIQTPLPRFFPAKHGSTCSYQFIISRLTIFFYHHAKSLVDRVNDSTLSNYFFADFVRLLTMF